MYQHVIYRLKARLRPNIGFTLRGNLAVFTRSAVTPPKVNRSGWNLEHSEYITQLLWVGPGRFWARSAQYREFERQAKFCFSVW